MELSFDARIGSIWESYVIANAQEGNKILYLEVVTYAQGIVQIVVNEYLHACKVQRP